MAQNELATNEEPPMAEPNFIDVNADSQSIVVTPPRQKFMIVVYVSRIFLEPMVRIRFIIEPLRLDEPSSLVEMLCFRERAVSLKSQDYHSP